MQLRVVTFNIRFGNVDDGENSWQHRKHIFFELIRKLQPDILALQEVYPFQREDIAQEFPHLGHIGGTKYHGVKVDPDKDSYEDFDADGCVIFFNAEKIKAVHWQTLWHSDNPDVPGSRNWGNKDARITLMANLLVNSQPLIVFNLHAHHVIIDEYQKKLAQQLQKQISAALLHAPVILLGDFNISTDSDLYRSLNSINAHGKKFQDSCVQLAKKIDGTFHKFTGTPNDEGQIDWILISSDLTARAIEKNQFAKNGRYPSDHFPVVLDLEFAN